MNSNREELLFGRVKAAMKPAFSDPPDETVSQKIGRYEILEKVSEGGCGVLHVAEQTEPGKRLKQCNPRLQGFVVIFQIAVFNVFLPQFFIIP